MLQRLATITQEAWQVGTNVQLVFAHRLLVVHVVERGDFVHGDLRHTKIFGNAGFAGLAHVSLFLLHDGKAGHHGRLLLLGRVLGYFARKSRFGRFGNHRSISPNTISMVPMMATTSASMWPRAISSSVARCAKPGARIFSRYGLLAPSLTR